jgi:hypothetical protein
MKYLKRTLVAASTLITLLVAGCADDAQVASRNLSKAADNFEIVRRVVFYNGITGEYMLSLEGLCSVENMTNRLAVTCKTGAASYKKHFLGLSDNVTYFAEQMQSAPANVYHYRVTFKPQAILPDIDFRGDTGAALDAVTPDTRD